jgi:hypothetical protein
MLQLLNVAIRFAFVFLFCGLVVSALSEVWLSFLDRRAAFVKESLRELLGDGGHRRQKASASSFISKLRMAAKGSAARRTDRGARCLAISRSATKPLRCSPVSEALSTPAHA